MHAFRSDLDSGNTEDIKADVDDISEVSEIDNIYTKPIEQDNKNSEKDRADISNPEDYLTLDSKKDWYTHLSGGEKKKIMVVSVIIKKPDILLLDEIFSGLDSASISIAQQMLKKYLPNALILSIDHHAKDNNFNDFYNGELHFHDNNIKKNSWPNKNENAGHGYSLISMATH